MQEGQVYIHRTRNEKKSWSIGKEIEIARPIGRGKEEARDGEFSSILSSKTPSHAIQLCNFIECTYSTHTVGLMDV